MNQPTSSGWLDGKGDRPLPQKAGTGALCTSLTLKIFAISDLHLSFASDKPMDKFGDVWVRHWEKIEANWRRLIGEADLVLVPGDHLGPEAAGHAAGSPVHGPAARSQSALQR